MTTPTSPAQDWRRFGRTTLLPLVLLVALLVLLGQWHVDLASGYTAPRVVLDPRGGFVFWDGGTRGSGFFFRPIEGLDELGSRRWRPGSLADAALSGDRLVALYAPQQEEQPWFYSLYRRKTLERTWSAPIQDPDLELDHPRHLAALGDAVFVLGTDRRGALRAARLTGEGALRPIPAALADAARVEPTAQGEAEEPADAPGREGVPAPLSYASAAADGRLVLVWRVATGPKVRGVAPGEVRWTTFDGESFGPLHRLEADLLAFACDALPAAAGPAQVQLYGVAREATEARIERWRLSAAGDAFEPAGGVDYQREGLTGAGGVVALAAAANPNGELLFAQIGATIRYRVRSGETWGPWLDLARRPVEQMAVVYGWFGSLMLLCVLLVGKGLEVLRRRARGLPAPSARAAPTVPPSAPAALFERALAFAIDLGIVLAVATALGELLPAVLARAEVEPKARIALLALMVVLLLVYFVTFEVAFARTPGKLAVGLEVQDVDGGPAATSALVYRNLFRIELLLPPATLMPLLTLVLMLTTPQKQRPGDLVAGTTVRRAEAAPAPAPIPGGAERGSES